jgi:hypothetical protein
LIKATETYGIAFGPDIAQNITSNKYQIKESGTKRKCDEK